MAPPFHDAPPDFICFDSTLGTISVYRSPARRRRGEEGRREGGVRG